MNEAKELVPQDEVRLGALTMRPEAVVSNATKLANALADVVKERKLYSNIRNKKYVRVEGWNTLGAMLGVLPRERDVEEIDNGYRAYVELVRTSDGTIIGGASSICTRDENRWASADPYAIRSMAVTRATGKAFRLGFSWIMKLAGYEATPAEEMDFVEGDYEETEEGEPKKANPKKAKPKRPLEAGMVRDLIKQKIEKYRKKDKKASEDQLKLIQMTYTKLFNSDNERYAVTDWLGLPKSTKNWTDPVILAILDWLALEEIEEDGHTKYIPSQDAITESKRMWRETQLDQGQKELM